MDYDQLRLFLHLSRSLHFGRTSRECHISPSALSRTVQRLERDLGWPLLERDRRQVKLTAEGARFAEHARETLERWDALREGMKDPTDILSGTISIFASVTACQSFLPRLLAAFRQRHPEIHIALETGYAADAMEMVEKGKVDVAIAALPDRVSSAMAARVLLYTPLVAVAPALSGELSRALDRQPVSWDEIPIVLPAAGLARAQVDRWFRSKRVRPAIYSEVTGSEAILSLVALGCGVGIVPRLVVDKSPLRAEVRPLEVEPAIGEFRVGLCTLRRKLTSPIIKAFWESTDSRARPG